MVEDAASVANEGSSLQVINATAGIPAPVREGLRTQQMKMKRNPVSAEQHNIAQ